MKTLKWPIYLEVTQTYLRFNIFLNFNITSLLFTSLKVIQIHLRVIQYLYSVSVEYKRNNRTLIYTYTVFITFRLHILHQKKDNCIRFLVQHSTFQHASQVLTTHFSNRNLTFASEALNTPKGLLISTWRILCSSSCLFVDLDR